MDAKIFVGNLNFRMGEEGLSQIFSTFGKIDELKVVKDHETGRSRGFAFITYASREEADVAIAQMDGKEVDGRQIRVNLAESKPRKKGKFGPSRHNDGY